jgi:uridylate kinase
MASQGPYRRVVLKLSGEALCAPGGFGIDPDRLDALARQLAELQALKVQAAVVIGGGNFLRGRALAETGALARTTADAMGMLATVMNALALGDALARRGTSVRVHAAGPAAGFCEPYVRGRADRQLSEGRLVLLAGGTGSPFFTTDTCAALRACELGADVVLKATKVDGVFEDDPARNPDARKFDRLSYADVLARRLGVMDLAAVSLCMESRIPVIVFRLETPGALPAAVRGEPVGTIISADEAG